MSCLAEQAKILVAEAEENNLGNKADNERWQRWIECSLCEQRYHRVVSCAVGLACWKTYLGRPETDQIRRIALSRLGNGLSEAGHHEAALSVKETELAMKRCHGTDEESLLVLQSNLAMCYRRLGRHKEALALKREVYLGKCRLRGDRSEAAFSDAISLVISLCDTGNEAEALSFLRERLPVAQDAFGPDHQWTLWLRRQLARILLDSAIDGKGSEAGVIEAKSIIADTVRRTRRVFGITHPFTEEAEALRTLSGRAQEVLSRSS